MYVVAKIVATRTVVKIRSYDATLEKLKKIFTDLSADATYLYRCS